MVQCEFTGIKDPSAINTAVAVTEKDGGAPFGPASRFFHANRGEDIIMRSRERIIANLETVYREAYERAKETSNKERMMDLDASFQREQLMLEVLLDVRDALYAVGKESSSESALKKLNTLRKIARFAR